MTDLTFVYFKMRALGEAPQMMLHYRNQPYRYVIGLGPFRQALRHAADPAAQAHHLRARAARRVRKRPAGGARWQRVAKRSEAKRDETSNEKHN